MINKDYLIQFTQNLYRLTLLFPKKEPLRYKMREIADEILADLISLNNQPLNHPQRSIFTIVKKSNRDLEVLDSFFEVAKNQNWVSLVELLRIQEEYNRIKAEIKKIGKHPQKKIEEPKLGKFKTYRGLTPAKFTEVRPLQNLRQEKILEILKEKGRVQVWQVKEIFPEVSKRTLRRDFEFLLKQNIVERIGERNNTFYQLLSETKPSEAQDEAEPQRAKVGQW